MRSRAYYAVVTLHFHCAHADPACLPSAVPLSQQRGAGFRIAVFLLESPPPVDSCQTCNRHPGLRRLQRQGEVLCTLLAAYEGKHFLATVASLDHRWQREREQQSPRPPPPPVEEAETMEKGVVRTIHRTGSILRLGNWTVRWFKWGDPKCAARFGLFFFLFFSFASVTCLDGLKGLREAWLV